MHAVNTWTRRQLVARGMAGAIGLSHTNQTGKVVHAQECTTASDIDLPFPTAVAPTQVPEVLEAFTGPIYGHHVNWDLDTWRYGGDYARCLREESVTLESLVIHMVTLVHINWRDYGFADLDDVEKTGPEAFLGEFSSSDKNVVHLWRSDAAVGFPIRFSDYSQNYVEYTPTADREIWGRVRYQAAYNGPPLDRQGTTDNMLGAWIDDAPMVQAVDVTELVEAIEENM